MFSVQEFFGNYCSSTQSRIIFCPSCNARGFLTYLPYDLQFFCDARPRTKEQRIRFWKYFRASILSNHEILISTTKSRIAGINSPANGTNIKTCVLRFENNLRTLARICAAGLKISCLVVVTDSCGEGRSACVWQRLFFQQVLQNMHEDGLRIIYDHSPIPELQSMIDADNPKIGDVDQMFISGRWYSITLVKDAVWGLPGACEVLLNGISLPR